MSVSESRCIHKEFREPTRQYGNKPLERVSCHAENIACPSQIPKVNTVWGNNKVNPLETKKVKILLCPMLPERTLLFGRFRGFAQLSFW
jgi:hypothetical protein